uniref:Transposase n=5 Tax=Magnetococcus massalia (strain MO-1) TaxID=451514 RepID=A0A1S7LE36_MAGMO|nr:transposase [Candidatus Magnetococcus massalia]CRH05043.1 transposase [Candidatus Magnetococcus massalia]CRH05091.1 transposase [Candidatus Magnetococcus massalia]CRH05185.1 transposase [Candidatus Magnetococcus massalia]CRH05228.1 transposase [Candidatus Magnetococcus massalia]
MRPKVSAILLLFHRGLWLMNTGKTIFSQVTEFLPMHTFRQCVERYSGNRKVQTFSCLDQFLCMIFAQLTYRESLRDIEACLRAQQSKLYHMGIRGRVSRSTLADANENRDWRIYADFAQSLIHTARQLYQNDDFGIDLQQTVYALDSTTVDLCLSVFPWAKFRKTKSAVKLHTLLDLRGNIPTFIHISDGKLHDVNVLDEIIPEPGSFYVMDRGYLDFARLYLLDQCGAFFVTRAKSNLGFRRLYSRPVDKSSGLQCDQTIVLITPKSAKEYPAHLRRIKFFDSENNKVLVFLTNDFTLPALTIAQLYRSRWQVELFFKWIKQHLRIKSFFGTSENAVKTQIWIAISVYVLVAIIKKKLKLEASLYTILQILSVSIFEKTPFLQMVTNRDVVVSQYNQTNQLKLFD